MVSASSAIISIAAAAGMLQMCPAPVAILGPVLGGVAAGAIGGGATICAKYCPDAKRSLHGSSLQGSSIQARDIPPGVSQESIDQCTQQINDQKNNGGMVMIQDQGESSILVTSVPPACMNLATVLTGNPAQAGGPIPVPQGSDSLSYTGLTPEDRRNLANALGA